MCKCPSSKELNDREFLALNIQQRIEYIDSFSAQGGCYISEEEVLAITQRESSEIFKNYFHFESLSNQYSLRKDFTASDFAEILGRMESHNQSHNSSV